METYIAYNLRRSHCAAMLPLVLTQHAAARDSRRPRLRPGLAAHSRRWPLQVYSWAPLVVPVLSV
jgi:hypothetical protein